MTQGISEIIEGIDKNGLTLFDYNQTLDSLQGGMNEIYAKDGETINFDSSSPDGQLTNIIAQLISDNKELIREVYNSFNPDNCSGTVQDSRYALNYITRNNGTFTIQDIEITVNQTVTLEGLDGRYNDINAASYTVSDNAGNLWYLIATSTIQLGLGETTITVTLPFRSRLKGDYTSPTGTIQNQVTKVLGVISVNNLVAPTAKGQPQETDAQFRVRRNRSTAIKGQNNYDAMNAQLLELDGVTDAIVFVNDTDTPNTTVTGDPDNGVPAYSIWAIVIGGDQDDIATVIYQNGCGLNTFGDIPVTTRNVAGQVITINYDEAASVRLYIKFDVKITQSDFQLNTANLADMVARNLNFRLNAPAETSYITEVAANQLLSFGTGAYVLDVKLSTGADCTLDTSGILSGSGITNITLNNNAFATMVSDVTGNYSFNYAADNNWYLSGNAVNLSEYGIKVVGTPINHDSFSVDFTAVGTWEDFIASPSLKNIFTVSADDIDINTI